MSIRGEVVASALACAAMTACSSDAQLFMSLPPHEGAVSMVVAIEKSSGVQLFARTMESGSTVFKLDGADLGGDDAIRIVALLYDETLAQLDLPEGKVDAAQPTDSRARALQCGDGVSYCTAQPLKMFAASVDLTNGGSPPSWEDASQLSTALAAFRLPARSTPCAEFDISLYELEDATNGTFMVPLDEDSVLIGLLDGKFFRVDKSGSVRQVLPVEGYAPYLAAIPAEPGSVWLGGHYGAMYKMTIEGDQMTRQAFAASPKGERIHWFAGRADAESTDLYLLSIEGTLEHFDGNNFSLVHQFQFIDADLDWKAGVTMVDRHEAVSVFAFNPEVVRVRDGVATEEETPPSGALHTVVHAPDFGTVAGDSEGQMLKYNSGAQEWERLEGSPLRVWMLSLAPYEDGFVFGSAFGNFGQYHKEYGFCELQMPVAFAVRHLVVLGRDIFVFGENPNTEKTPIAVMRRRGD